MSVAELLNLNKWFTILIEERRTKKRGRKEHGLSNRQRFTQTNCYQGQTNYAPVSSKSLTLSKRSGKVIWHQSSSWFQVRFNLYTIRELELATASTLRADDHPLRSSIIPLVHYKQAQEDYKVKVNIKKHCGEQEPETHLTPKQRAPLHSSL